MYYILHCTYIAILVSTSVIAFVNLSKQIAAFSDMTTSQLSGDNSLLKDEVEMLRGQLMEANDTIVSLQSDIKLKTKEVERKGKTKQVNAVEQELW